MKTQAIILGVSVGLLTFANAVLSATYVVSPEGNDKAEGTEKSPWETVVRASRALTPGDVLLITGGTYDEVFELKGLLGEKDRTIVIKCRGAQRVLFDFSDSGGRAIQITDCAYVRLQGIEIARGGNYGIIMKDSHHCVIQGNVVHDCKGGGVKLQSSNDNIVRGNVCYYNDSGLFIGGGSTRNLVEANVLAFGNKSSENADGIASNDCKKNTYRYNMLVGNNDDGLDMWTSMESLIEYNLAALNGDQKQGDGNGFKLGGRWKDNHPERAVWVGGRHTVRCNVSFNNLSTGFTDNGSKGNVYERNVAYGNRNTGSYASAKYSDPANAEPILVKLKEQYKQIFDAGLIRPETNLLPPEFDKVRAFNVWP